MTNRFFLLAIAVLVIVGFYLVGGLAEHLLEGR